MRTLALLLLFSLYSCSYILDQQIEENIQNNYVSPYKGKYSGSYTGDLNGGLVLNVNKDGLIEITRSSITGEQKVTYQNLLGGGSGAISGQTSFTEFMLIGSLETKSGTWKMGSSSGTWKVSKD